MNESCLDLFPPPPGPSPEELAAEEDRRIKRQRRQEYRTRQKLMRRLDHNYGERERKLSEIKVKRKVRARDGYRCRDCGLSRKQHYANFGQNLHVHRINPGCVYRANDCITLCKDCHAKKKNREEEDIFSLLWHMYHQDNVDTFSALARIAKERKLSVSILAGSLIREHVFPKPTLTAKGSDCRP